MTTAVNKKAQLNRSGAVCSQDGQEMGQNKTDSHRSKNPSKQQKADLPLPIILRPIDGRDAPPPQTNTASLIQVLDAKDHYTLRHSERVTALAVHLATSLRVESSVMRRIRLSGLLHDVGKVNVSSYILNKRYPLTRQELRIVRQHVNTGFDLLNNVNYPYPVSRAVRHHHERWDGTGYPDRLEGKDIPLASRFVALADAFDAMASHRPYRKTLSREKIIQELQRGKGKQFDPTITDTLLGWYKRNGTIIGTLSRPCLSPVEPYSYHFMSDSDR